MGIAPIKVLHNNNNNSCSYFQGLAPEPKETAQQLLCRRVQESCETTAVQDASCQASVRRVVDVLAALMDNFAVGESWSAYF